MIHTARRDFLKAAATFAAAAVVPGCGVFRNAQGSALLASLPHHDDYMPVLRVLFETLLPFDHPRFAALGREPLETRLLDYFPLGDASRYASLRRALVYFDDLALQPHSAAPIIDAERRLLEARGVRHPLAVAQAQAERDRRAASRVQYSAPLFTALDAVERAQYLSAWATSALIVKRRFYRTTKSLVMIAAFSMEASWRAIGYDGPLVRTGHEPTPG